MDCDIRNKELLLRKIGNYEIKEIKLSDTLNETKGFISILKTINKTSRYWDQGMAIPLDMVRRAIFLTPENENRKRLIRVSLWNEPFSSSLP